MLILPSDVEILRLAYTVVSRNETLDYSRKIILVCKCKSIFYMVNNHLCTTFGSKMTMWIAASLVLRKEYRSFKLTNIVIKGGSTHKLCTCSNLLCHLT